MKKKEIFNGMECMINMIEVKTSNGIIQMNSEKIAAFMKENGEKTLKQLFNLNADDEWLKKILFSELNLSTRAHNTISQSFAVRTTEEQTLDYLSDFTVNQVLTRRNAGYGVLKEILNEMYRITKEQSEKAGIARDILFDPGVFE